MEAPVDKTVQDLWIMWVAPPYPLRWWLRHAPAKGWHKIPGRPGSWSAVLCVGGWLEHWAIESGLTVQTLASCSSIGVAKDWFEKISPIIDKKLGLPSRRTKPARLCCVRTVYDRRMLNSATASEKTEFQVAVRNGSSLNAPQHELGTYRHLQKYL